MRIAVIGAGGVGGAFGAALAKAGGDVTFVARGAHLAAMRASGLRVLGPRGDIHLNPTQATDDPASIGPVDFVLFCVKLWDVESAGAAIRPLVGHRHGGHPAAERDRRQRAADPHPRQGGRDGRRGADQRHHCRAGRDPSDRHLHASGVRRTGRPPQPARRRLPCAVPERRIQLGEQRRDPHRAVGEIRPARHQQLRRRSTRLPFGKLRDDPDVFALFEKGYAEVAAVGRARGIAPAGGARGKIAPEARAAFRPR